MTDDGNDRYDRETGISHSDTVATLQRVSIPLTRVPFKVEPMNDDKYAHVLYDVALWDWCAQHGVIMRHGVMEAPMQPAGYHYELCRNTANHWYWRRVSRNGEIQFVAQAYHSKSNAKRAILRLDPNATITTATP